MALTIDLDVNGRTRAASVEPVAGAEGRFRVTIDGTEHVVDARRIDARTLSLVLASGAVHDVDVVDGAGAGELLVGTRDGVVPVVVNGRRRRRGDAAGDGSTGAQRVVAPMPGKVVRVLVAPGVDVAARQGLVVMEAMKMECELSAARAGRVTDIRVEPGMSVEKGFLLAVVE